MEDERGSITLTPDFVSDLDNYDLQAMLKAWQKRPLLVIHGSEDETVNVEQAQRSFCSCRAAEETGYCKRGRP